ncbi:MAG: PhoX family protein [Gammaproteobacteria bacterium]|nr:PhoX family protein [Gammaproteobacteria bacterium]
MLNRRRFLQSLIVAAVTPALPAQARAGDRRVAALEKDPNGMLDLPKGFSYRIVSRAGMPMSDGLVVPGYHDGMAAFATADDRIRLVCNHELAPSDQRHSAFADASDRIFAAIRDRLYDQGGGSTPGAGGTTTTVFNPRTGETERQYLSLAGTELNCAGGTTPWGSWLSCEECFATPLLGLSNFRFVQREQRHGYVFEVPASADGLIEPRPIKAMGRFEHEAAAVHHASGIVYMTEDRHHSLFYRYIPDVPGKLHEGGRLQALAFGGASAFRTHNWDERRDMPLSVPHNVRWIDLDNVDPDDNDLRLRGAEAGAAMFARGEGLCTDGEEVVFTCTIGGRARRGQIFHYRPSPFEGTAREPQSPGQLTLIAEADRDSLLQNCDNITMAPWGDLLVCEDTEGGHCGLVGVRPDGSQYQLADNAYSSSELAGVCFAPDGNTLFVNIQYPGTTLAITGPWPT